LLDLFDILAGYLRVNSLFILQWLYGSKFAKPVPVRTRLATESMSEQAADYRKRLACSGWTLEKAQLGIFTVEEIRDTGHQVKLHLVGRAVGKAIVVLLHENTEVKI